MILTYKGKQNMILIYKKQQEVSKPTLFEACLVRHHSMWRGKTRVLNSLFADFGNLSNLLTHLSLFPNL